MGTRLVRLAAVTVALVAGPATAHAAAGPEPRPVPRSAEQRPVTGTVPLGKDGAKSAPRGAVRCDGVGYDSTRWWGNCRVLSGHARAVTHCSDTTRYGSWVGVGYWRFGGDCHGHRLLRFGVQLSD